MGVEEQADVETKKAPALVIIISSYLASPSCFGGKRDDQLHSDQIGAILVHKFSTFYSKLVSIWSHWLENLISADPQTASMLLSLRCGLRN